MTTQHAPRLAYTDDGPIDPRPRPHLDDIAIDGLAAQQKARMAEKRAQGFNGWDDPRRCSPEKLSILMAQSMCKGKVVDVANFAAMLLARNAPAALVGEHATRAFLLGARECQAATIDALRGHLDRARSLYRAAQGEICSLLHSDAPPNKAKLGELNDYLGFALSSIDRLDVPTARGGQPCQHCGGSGRQEDVFEQADNNNPVYALGEELVKAQTPDADPSAVDTLIEALDCTLREHGFTVVPAEDAPSVHVPTDGRIAETAQRISRLLLGDARKVDCDIIDSHIRALLAAPAAAEAQDQALDQVMRERDAYHQAADDLANAISDYFGIDIGEHSNANDPWLEALEIIESAERPAATVAQPDRVEWDKFPAWLIDHHEGDTITEELLSRALADMLKAHPLAAPEVAHSRQAQGGALLDEDIDALVDIDGIAGDYGTAEWRRNYARAILARAASEPRALLQGKMDQCFDCNAPIRVGTVCSCASEPRADGLEAYSYQQLFNAIAAATQVSAGHVAISVETFRAAIAAQKKGA